MMNQCVCLELFILACLFCSVLSDTPANCSYDSVKGQWTFYIGPGGGDKTINCSEQFEIANKLGLTLKYPDIASVDGEADSNDGFWTMIYNQGFEVVVGGRKYFAFSNYTGKVSHCQSTLNGWSHDISGNDWACYYGVKEPISLAAGVQGISEQVYSDSEFPEDPDSPKTSVKRLAESDSVLEESHEEAKSLEESNKGTSKVVSSDSVEEESAKESNKGTSKLVSSDSVGEESHGEAKESNKGTSKLVSSDSVEEELHEEAKDNNKGTSKLFSSDSVEEESHEGSSVDLDRKYVKNPDFVRKVNEVADTWVAVHYPEFETMTLRDLRMMGGWTTASSREHQRDLAVELDEVAQSVRGNYSSEDESGSASARNGESKQGTLDRAENKEANTTIQSSTDDVVDRGSRKEQRTHDHTVNEGVGTRIQSSTDSVSGRERRMGHRPLRRELKHFYQEEARRDYEEGRGVHSERKQRHSDFRRQGVPNSASSSDRHGQSEQASGRKSYQEDIDRELLEAIQIDLLGQGDGRDVLFDQLMMQRSRDESSRRISGVYSHLDDGYNSFAGTQREQMLQRFRDRVASGDDKQLVTPVDSSYLPIPNNFNPEHHHRHPQQHHGGEGANFNDPPSTSGRPLSYHELPQEFNWRDKGDHLPPIVAQGSCGSCFAITTPRMFAARLSILTRGKVKVQFSPQDILSCSNYSQGCLGGIPYLVGKYAEDYGFVAEDCFPYTASDDSCSNERANCVRYYGTDYEYIGGYYGASNVPDMMTELVNNGPIIASMLASDDFYLYKGGIYRSTGVKDHSNPMEPVNHTVLIVGYGEQGGVEYWLAQNSWGEDWGEEGYFRIVRGTDEANIESSAFTAMPVVPS